MEKDFDGWNKKKKQIQRERGPVFCHEREVWWCSLGLNIGFEQDGSGRSFHRPVLILKGMSAQTFFVAPLTTSPSTHPLRPSAGVIAGKQSRVVLSQMRVIDTKRLIEKFGHIDVATFEGIRKTIKDML